MKKSCHTDAAPQFPPWEVEMWTCRLWFLICLGHNQFDLERQLYSFVWLQDDNALQTLKGKESIIFCLFAFFVEKGISSVAFFGKMFSKLSPKDCITLKHSVNSSEKLSDPCTKLPGRTSARNILGPSKKKEKGKKGYNFRTFDAPRKLLLHIRLWKMFSS